MSADRLHSQAGGATKPDRHLAFTTRMGPSAVAVLAVAIIAAVILLGPRSPFGLGLSPSPSPEPATPNASAPVEPSATPEVTPSATPMPTATPQPTPTPVAEWTGLEWPEPILLSSSQDSSFRVTDSLWWHGRYIGTGYVIRGVDPQTGEWTSPSGITRIPLFLESPDGVNWDVVQEMEGFVDVQGDSYAHPVRVVPVGDGLVAWSGYIWGGVPRTLWQSDDGRSWIEIDSPSWREGWTGRAKAIAGGPSGVVAIGAEGPGCCMNPDGPAIIGHSTDGVTWTWLSDAPEFAHASFTDVEATRDGFVLVGWVGETEADARERGEWQPTGRPAAWTSTDGRSWTAADVQGPELAGGRLTQVLVGDEGLFATGVASPTEQWWETTSGWASVDGRSWDLIGALGEDVPAISVMASDGLRMVILGRESPETLELAGWTSTDGTDWTRLVFFGAPAPAADRPEGATPESGWLRSEVGDIRPSTRLLRDGVVAYGAVPGGDAAWVAVAIER
jgi:hypothetical protein